MPEINIVVPRHLHRKLKRLAELQQETNGVFLYTPNKVRGQTLWQVHGLFMLGRGSAYHVEAHPAYMRAGNALLDRLRRQSPRAGWEFVKVHTHCRGTGRTWFHRFSAQDLEAVKTQVAENPKFTLMMYSPTHHIAAGHSGNSYNVVVVESTDQHRSNSDNLAALMRRVVQEHGIVLPKIEATIKPRRR